MRLWSIHPKYLDKQGLLAVWREGLLAKKVLEGKTKGYKNHPQLIRFKKHKSPLKAINAYLYEIFKEAERRGYNFNKQKIVFVKLKEKIFVKSKQVEFEFNHLLNKLKKRNPKKYFQMQKIKTIKINPVFTKIKGEIEVWEKVCCNIHY